MPLNSSKNAELRGFSSLSYFFSRGEWAIIFFSLIIVMFAILDAVQKIPFSVQERFWIHWIQLVICFNGAHIVFTFLNVAMIPEFRKIAISHYKLTWTRQVIIFLVILSLFLIAHDVGFYKDLFAFRLLFIFLAVFIPSIHGCRQSLGLSLMINNRIRNVQSSDRDTTISDNQARRLEHLVAYCLIVGLSIFYARPYLLELGISKVLKSSNVSFICSSIAVILFFWMLFHLKSRKAAFFKSLFGIRYLVFALAPFSFIANVGIFAIHGLEYLEIQTHLFQRSRIQKNLFKFYWTAAFLLGVANILLDIPSQRWFRMAYPNNTNAQLLIIFGATLLYFHYFLDSILFRMKNVAVRQEILPLLRDENEKIYA